MSDNVEFIRRNFGAEGEHRLWEADDRRRVAEAVWDPDIVYVEAPEWPGSGVYRGIDQVLARFLDYQEVLGKAETTVGEITDLGDDRVFFTFRYTSVSTGGMPVGHLFAYVFTIRDGRLVHWRAYWDAESARRELGI